MLLVLSAVKVGTLVGIQEGALVVVKPPVQLVAWTIAKVQNGIYVGVKTVHVHWNRCAVAHSFKDKVRRRINALPIEAAEHGGGRETVKTVAVI
jgi:hypothetical protein